MEQIYQLGAPAVILIFAIKEYFSYQKSKKNGAWDGKAILQELQTLNNNHLHSLETAINDGNAQITKAINDGNMQMIQVLGKIEGLLSNQK